MCMHNLLEASSCEYNRFLVVLVLVDKVFYFQGVADDAEAERDENHLGAEGAGQASEKG